VISKTKHCPRASEHERQLAETGAVAFCRDCFAISEIDRLLVPSAFEKAKKMCAGGEYDLVVLDEIFWAIKEKLVKEQDLLALLSSRARNCEIVLTGRGAPLSITAASDYVSYLNKEKHPFDKGVLSRAGIDY